MRRMLECLLAALCIAMVLMLPAAQADDGTAWMDEPCPVTGIHNLQFEDIQIGDCTHESIVRWYCPDCGKSHNNIEPAPGHQWDEGKVTKEPTCTEAGERTYTCTRLITNIWCGATYTEAIPALGHDPETISGKAATCTESGLTEGSRCKRCGGTIKAQETIPALGHAAQAISGRAATCTEAGLSEGSKCTRCGATLKAQESIPALGHDWDGGKVTKEATADAEGVRTYTCKRNSSHTKTESIPRLAPPPVTDPPAHTHKWGDWFVEEKGTCVKKALLRRVCACGAEEYQYGDYGDHDWGEWRTAKEPTATEDGLEERICKIESSHREEKPIPATGKAELTIYLEAQDYDTDVPKTEFREGESVWFYGYVVNTGTVDLELRDRVIDIPGVKYWNEPMPETKDGIVLKPGEKYEGNAYWFISIGYKPVSAADVAPGTETAELYGTITYSVQVPGYKPGTDEVLCTAAASCTIGVLKDENALKPSLLVTTTWAPDAGAGKRYVGAIVNVDDTLTNTGNCDLYLPNKDGRADSVDAPHPKGDGELSDHYRLAPGESLTVHNYHHFVLESDVEKGALYRNGFSTTYSAYYMDENGEKQRIFSNSFEENIPLTYPDGVTPEEKKPQLTLNFLYDDPAKEVYDPEDSAYAYFSMANTGNVTLRVELMYTLDGIEVGYWNLGVFDPGKSCIDGFGLGRLERGIAPGTETEDLLGTVTTHNCLVGFDPDTGEELCRSETVTRTWKVGKPGFTPWPIPEESDIYGKLTTGASSSSAGYQLGELYIVMLEIQNTGKVTIPADGITFSDPSNGQTYSVFSNDFKPGDSGIAFGWLHLITEEDVKNGFVYYPPVQLTWTDPDSGNPRTVYTNSLMLIVSNRTGLLLRKDIGNGPENGSYYREGETIPWTLTATNNSNEPIRNVTVTDQGVTVGTFQEIAAGETVTCNVPPYVVTEYDAFAGKVSNYATATGEDLRGTVHTWNSNTVTAPTNQFADPLPPEDGKTGEPKEDPGDPMGAVYGLHAGASVRKEEDGGPMNGSYYELDEEIHFTITVKNTGDTPLENVSVADSLNGIAPIGTAASIAPGAEVSFTFIHRVTQADIDAGWVTNSATVIYTFDGGKPGTPQKSNEVKVKAGDKEDNITGGGHFTPIPPATPSDGTLQPVTLPDGTPLTTPDGKPIIAPPGTVPVIGPDGKPVTAPGGVYTGPDGTPVYIPAGTPVLMLPDGSYCVIGSDGRAILTDANGNPILDGNGFVIFLGWSIESVTCELRLDSLGDSEAAYTLHACSEHAGAAKDAEAAGLAGDWAGAAEIWRGEVEKLYEKFYEAADDEGKAALVQERAAFLAYADAWQALAGDEAAAETLRFKCAEMCCILHTLPAELPGSIVGSHREVINGQQWDQSVREIGALNGADSAVTETYAGAEARTLKDTRTMLAGAKTYNYGDVFERGRRCWQITLDNAVNIAYKAADKETRKRIVAWRTALDTLYEAEKPLLEMLYPDSDTTVWEELMNLYKDRVFDSVKIR